MDRDLRVAKKFFDMVSKNHEAYVSMPHPIGIEKYLWELLKEAIKEEQ